MSNFKSTAINIGTGKEVDFNDFDKDELYGDEHITNFIDKVIEDERERRQQ
jgi:hypothetical protein